jgi:hypothetical protein
LLVIGENGHEDSIRIGRGIADVETSCPQVPSPTMGFGETHTIEVLTTADRIDVLGASLVNYIEATDEIRS